jgi:hypothetical protein
MSFSRKPRFLILFSAVLVIGIVSTTYIVTMHRQGNVDRPFSDPDSVLSSFSVGQRTGPNLYTAGIPFESKVTRQLNADGCPCTDVTKFEVLLNMAATREFLLNVFVWAVPVSLGAFLLRRK